MSYQKVILLGNVGIDPEVRDTKGGKVCRFTLATSKKDKNGEQKTSWHTIICFGKLAEICGKYVSKGSQVMVDGEINYRNYEGEKGMVYLTEINASQVQFLGSKKKDEKKDEFPNFDSADDIPF